MRIFHLADLHIGKKVNGYSMVDDQRVLLEQVADLVHTHKPDALILAGDIYDRRNPPIEAISLFDAFTSKIVLDEGVPILAIGGNHDGGERLGFSNAIQAKAGLHLVGSFHWPLPKVRMYDADGTVDFYLMAYADLAVLHQMVPETVELDYPKTMDYLMQHTTLDASARNVLLAHGVVTGSEPAQTCDSERVLSIGGTEYWQSEALAHFDYVALGHLHGAQRAGGDHIRYAGSLMQYSFSEENQKKVMLDIELDGQGLAQFNSISLEAPRKLVTLKGNLDQLLSLPEEARAIQEDYLRIVLEDEGALIEPMQRLKNVYPNIMLLERTACPLQKRPLSTTVTLSEKRSPIDLFQSFYTAVMEQEPEPAMVKIMTDTFEQLQKEEL